jgi:[protein-PII] uridylyltransferase
MTIEEKLHSSPADAIRDRFLGSGDAARLLIERTALMDGVIGRAHQEWLAPAFPHGLALMAVGGYGRRELFPHSDIDLLVLLEGTPPTGQAKEALSRFLQTLWDSKMHLSHSVHSVRDCTELHEGNIELNVSLLDQRFLAGDSALYGELAAKLPKFYQSQKSALARALCRLARERHRKYHDTIHHLEPNLKEAPGGLRDLHLMAWLDKLAGAAPAQDDDLAQARAYLFALRCLLHYRSDRDNNVLSFDSQEEFAELPFLGVGSPASLMRRHFRGARTLHRAAARAMDLAEAKGNSLLAGFRDWRARLSNNELTVSRDRVMFKSAHQLERDPELALRLFHLVGRHRVPLHAETERLIQEHMPALESHFRQPRQLWPAINDILSQPNAPFALRAMHESGVLGAVFPEWAAVECYVIRDFNHRYTVDEHTLIAIESLEELAKADDPQRKRFAGLMEEVDSMSVVRLALVFHDTGKGEESESHCVESARLADIATRRIGMPEAERKMMLALIERHLDLSNAMSRDLGDPATARWLADRLGTIEVLKGLTLLTYADITAVNPTAMSPWRLDQLWRVYRAAQLELTRELDTERITSVAAMSPERQAFLKGFPSRYLRIHTEAEIQAHMALEEQRREVGLVVDIRRRNGSYELTVLTKDRMFLFASVAGALASFGMNILKAEAFSNQQGTILDTFTFADPMRTLELNPSDLDRLRRSLERVISGRTDVKSLLRNRPKPVAPSKGSRIEASMSFDAHGSDRATLIEVVAQDRPGLLYDLASALSESGCNIELVLIDTEAHKAIDVFYVTQNGRKLNQAAAEALCGRLTAACGG